MLASERRLYPPFSVTEARLINAYQNSPDSALKLVCPNHRQPLVATTNGMVCYERCGYKVGWAYYHMLLPHLEDHLEGIENEPVLLLHSGNNPA